MNAILNKNEANLNNCTIYVTMFPCNECAKLIIQSNIKKIIYLCDKYSNTEQIKASKIMFKLAEVDFEKFLPNTSSFVIDFGNNTENSIVNT